MNVVDSFIYAGERALLILRMEELWDTVDEFVIIEADRTFTGYPRAIVSRDLSKIEGGKYGSKIRHYVVSFPEHLSNPWDREAWLRCQVWDNHLRHLQDNELVLFSDVDEIPSVEAIERVMIADPYDQVYVLESQLSYFYINFVANIKWYGTKIAKKGALEHHFKGNMQSLRECSALILPNGGWHISFLGGIDQAQLKLASYSHTEYDKPPFNTEEHIQRCILEKKDLFGRDIQWKVVDVDNADYYFPEYALQNPYLFPVLKR